MSTHHLRRLFAPLVLCLGVAACGGGDDAPPPPALGSVSGTVVASSDASPVAGAQVSAGAQSATTDADGRFTLTDVAAGSRVLLKIQAADFLDGLVALPVVANQTAVASARLVRAGTDTVIDPAQASVAGAAGSSAQVALPADALVTAAGGAAPAGAVTVRVTPIDPGTDPQSMPGDFTTSAGETLESFGALNVTLTDSNGAALQLKAGSSATIRIPLASRSADVPSTIPLFYLDESTGRWVQEGDAVLAGSGSERWYEGSVTHFTTWNADQVAATIFVDGCAVTDTGAPVTQGLAISVGLDYAGSATTGLDAQGHFRLALLRGGQATIHVEGANTSNSVVAGPAESDITLPVCLVISAAAQPPTIVQQPQAFAALTGGSAYFAVVASGTRPLAYQWRRNGVPIAGARGDVHFIAAVAQDDDGAVFDVVVDNAAGSVTSDGATLTVAAPVPPTITMQPASLAVPAGAAATFGVTATGTAPLAYQWQRDGTDIAGANGAAYTIPVTALADHGAVFRVRVSNAGGSVLSAEATLSVTGPVLSAPTITAQPQNRTVGLGQTAQFSVSVTGSPAPDFQWRRNGVPIAGATASSYTTPPATQADNGAVFSVVVSNSQGSVTSANATLTVTTGSVASRIELVRLLGMAPLFSQAGLLPFEATTDEGTAFIDPATVCSSGTLSVTLNGAAVTPGQLVPTTGTTGAVAIACDDNDTTYNGQTSVNFSITSLNPDIASATMNVSNMRVTDRFGSTVLFDITANGSASAAVNESISGANTVFVESFTPGAGATLRNEGSGLSASFSGGSVVTTDTEVTASGQPVGLNVTYNNLAFTVAGVGYVGSGAYQLSVTAGGLVVSGEVILSTGGVPIGRLFIDTDGVLKIEVDGVVQPFGSPPKRPARR
ncbi:MAG: immunoglobulin domain-containing protein [Piscinibacter sp.]|nr:immunoglobulin domain-containing protein [Piscinibacter sp.]